MFHKIVSLQNHQKVLNLVLTAVCICSNLAQIDASFYSSYSAEMVQYNSSDLNVTSVNYSSQPQSSMNCFYVHYSCSAVGFELCLCLASKCVKYFGDRCRAELNYTPSVTPLSDLALTDRSVACFVQPLLWHKIAALYGTMRLHCIASLDSTTLASVSGAASLPCSPLSAWTGFRLIFKNVIVLWSPFEWLPG